jgi:hypothetical protein
MKRKDSAITEAEEDDPQPRILEESMLQETVETLPETIGSPEWVMED